MYPDVKHWLHKYLQDRHPRKEVIVFESPSQRLNRLVSRLEVGGLLPPEWQSWDIQVDIVGFIRGRSSIEMVLVECKNKPITLAHLSQVIGYCRVVNPVMGIILSPDGISDSLKKLFEVYGRQDVLIYSKPARQSARRIILAQWNSQTGAPEPGSAIPAGSLG